MPEDPRIIEMASAIYEAHIAACERPALWAQWDGDANTNNFRANPAWIGLSLQIQHIYLAMAKAALQSSTRAPRDAKTENGRQRPRHVV